MCSPTKVRFNGKYAVVVAALGVLLSPGAAQAFTMEYYTYGGFAEVVDGFTKCALIFSSDKYTSLVGTVFCLSFFVSLIGAALYRLQTVVREEGVNVSKPEGIYSALLNAIIGSVLFLGIIVPTGTLQIYDPTEPGANQAVGGIPFIAVVAAGTANLVERTVVDLIDTAGSPLSYSKQSGLKGIQVMNSLMARGDESPAGDGPLGVSLQNYVNDCIAYELTRTGTTLTVDELKSGTASLISSFAKAVNPANFTTIYGAGFDPAGAAITCTAAWTSISTRMTGVESGDLFKETKKRACGDAGYNVYDSDAGKATNAYNQCNASTDALIKAIDPNWSFNKFMSEMYFSNQFWIGIAKNSPASFGNKSVATNGQSVIQEYLSTMGQKRGLVTAFATVLLPFIALLLPTKYWPKALGTLVTAYLICPIWGMLDAMTTGFYLTRAVNTWAGFLGNTWGVDQLSLWNSSAIKQMSTWGVYVAASFGIALSAARMVTGGLGTVVGGFGGAEASRSEGRLDMGKTGAAAMAREKTATGAGLADSTMDAARGYGRSMTMPNYNAGTAGQYIAQDIIGDNQAQGDILKREGGVFGSAGNTANNVGGKRAADVGTGIAQSADPSATTNASETATAIQISANNQLRGTAPPDVIATGITANTRAQAKEEVTNPGTNDMVAKVGYDNTVGSARGELEAHKTAQDNGFKGDMQAFRQYRTFMSSTGDYAAAAAGKHVADTYFGGIVENSKRAAELLKQAPEAKKAVETAKEGAHIVKPNDPVVQGIRENQAANHAQNAHTAAAGLASAASEQRTQAMANDLKALGPNATPEDYKAFAAKHQGVTPEAAQAAHQQMQAGAAGDRAQNAHTAAAGLESATSEQRTQAMANDLKALGPNATPEDYKAFAAKHQGVTPEAAQAAHQQMQKDNKRDDGIAEARLSERNMMAMTDQQTKQAVVAQAGASNAIADTRTDDKQRQIAADGVLAENAANNNLRAMAEQASKNSPEFKRNADGTLSNEGFQKFLQGMEGAKGQKYTTESGTAVMTLSSGGEIQGYRTQQTFDPKNADSRKAAEAYAKQVEAHSPKAAAAIRGNIEKGRGFTYTGDYDKSGKLVSGTADRGMGVSGKDKVVWDSKSESKSGSLKDSANTAVSGDSIIRLAENLTKVGQGTQYAGNEALLQASMLPGLGTEINKGAGLGASAVSNPAEFNAKVAGLSGVQSNALAPYSKHVGSDSTAFAVGMLAQAGFKTPSLSPYMASVTGHMKAEGQSQESWQQDIQAKTIQALHMASKDEAMKEAKAAKLNPAETAALVDRRDAEHMAKFTTALTGKQAGAYGTAVPAAVAAEVVKTPYVQSQNTQLAQQAAYPTVDNAAVRRSGGELHGAPGAAVTATRRAVDAVTSIPGNIAKTWRNR